MKSFLQSQEWADFQKSLGRKTWRVDDILIIKHDLPVGKNYLYSPHCGGNFLSDSFLKKIKEIAKKENAIFFKVEPLDINKNLLRKFKFRKSHSIQPKKTLILDISQSEKDLLEQMHQKTRYNIKLALKRGLKIQNPKGPTTPSLPKIQNFEKFWELLRDTAKRGKFRTHLKDYYKKILRVPGVELFVAIYKNKVVAVNIVMFCNKIAIYLHGASDYNYRNLMAPHLLQWKQIKEAKTCGCTEYDFWGIDEKRWPGVTRFKKGFGGEELSYNGSYDLVFQPIWYRIYKIARKIL